MSVPYDEVRARLREVGTLSSIAELLGWDQETMMPRRASDFRAEELALLARLIHQRATDPRLGELLARCEANAELTADPIAAANLREIRRDYDRAVKLPEDLVAEIGETSSRAVEAWKSCRRDNAFGDFLPWLDRQLQLNRRKAACLGASNDDEAYDVLLEDYEPGTTAAVLQRLFDPLRDALVPLIERVTESSGGPDPSLLEIAVPLERQHAFNRLVLEHVGFDVEAGRLDTSAHPFSSGVAPGDTRITTRYRERGLFDALGSTLHEAGHGMYEQGLPKAKLFGQPLAEAASLGIHESQSRLWENHVGRSRAFWVWAVPEARRLIGEPAGELDVEEVYRAVNVVRPHLIRVESDEVTYNLHILMRFDLERAMLRGGLAPADLPAAWNDRMRDDLGLEVPDDARGCLQDIHWAMGSFGYFPTYTLGNLYAAQLWDKLCRDVPSLDEDLARGRFGVVLDWLRHNVHAHGRRYPAIELCERVTGRPVGQEPLVRHLRTKLAAVYGWGDARAVSDG